MGEIKISHAGVSLAAVDHGGSGRDVVLIHGANRTLLDWQPLLEHLPGLRCVSYDLRGHGRSDVPSDGDYSWDAHLSDLDAVISTLGLQRPIVIGHSLGGDIACVHAARCADCPGIVDIDGFGGGHPSQYPGVPAGEIRAWRREQTNALVAALGPDELSESAVEAIVAAARAAAPHIGVGASFEEAAARRAIAPAAGALQRRPLASAQLAISAPLEGWDVFEVLANLRCATLAIHGTRRPPELAALPPVSKVMISALMDSIDQELTRLPARNPLVSVRPVPSAAHMVHLEAPREVAASVIEWLE